MNTTEPLGTSGVSVLDPAFPIGYSMPSDFPTRWPQTPPGRSPDPLPLLRERIPALAADVGRLRRRFASNGNAWTGAYIADRVADQIADLYGILTPSAAELVAWTYPGDDETAAGAVRLLDERWRQFQSRLGRKAA